MLRMRSPKLAVIRSGLCWWARPRGAGAGELPMLLERQVGDVRLERGSVVHLPSGTRFRHEIGVRMLLAYPSDLCFKRRTTGYTALYRFRKWLSRVGALVRVQPAGGATSFYRLGCQLPSDLRIEGSADEP